MNMKTKKIIEELQVQVVYMQGRNNELHTQLMDAKKLVLALKNYMGEDNFRNIVAIIENRE